MAQLVMVPVSYIVGRSADSVGRKPVFLAAFLVLGLRGLLLALGERPFHIIGVEALDGGGHGHRERCSAFSSLRTLRGERAGST